MFYLPTLYKSCFLKTFKIKTCKENICLKLRKEDWGDGSEVAEALTVQAERPNVESPAPKDT